MTSEAILTPKSVAVLFGLFILIPSILLRYFFECKYSLKVRKLTLQDNAIMFLFPSFIVLFIYNALILKAPIFDFRIPTDSLFNLDQVLKSGNIDKFLKWYAGLLFVNLIYGYFYGAIYSVGESDSKRLGNSLRDRTWEDIFKIMSKSVSNPLIYIKAKDGDIYRGRLENYAFNNNNLELITLKNALRTTVARLRNIEDDESDEKFCQEKIDLSDGVIVIPESNIANIWFKPNQETFNVSTRNVNIDDINEILQSFE